MALRLRDYQDTLLDRIRSRMQRKIKRILVVAPTGSGKTVLVATMLRLCSLKGMTSLFNVHRRELVKQSMAAFYKADVPHGVISSQFPHDYSLPSQICSVQTLVRRLDKICPPNLIVWDEAHHTAAGMWNNIYNYYPDAYHIGVTATPERTDGKGLGPWFDEIIEGPSVSELIKLGWLSAYKLYAPSSVDTTGIKRRMGDFAKNELEDLLDKPKIIGSAIDEYRKLANGKRNVIFCVSIKHSLHVVEQFNAAGIPALHVDGDTPALQRDEAIRMFAEGKIKVLSNVDLFGEGFDLPSIEVVTLLRPTQSLALFLQQVGRALRPVYAPGYDLNTVEGRLMAIQQGPKSHAIILDHVGNYQRHGLPDEKRDWTLEDRPRKQDNSEAGPRVCEICYAAQPPRRDKCIYCGHEFQKQEREIDQVDGDLSEVNVDLFRKRRRREQYQAQSLQELEELGKQRGYKHYRQWAKRLFQARQAKKLRGGRNAN